MAKTVYILMTNQMPFYNDYLSVSGVYEKEEDAFHDGVVCMRDRAGTRELYDEYKENCYCDGVNPETFEEYIANSDDLMQVIKTEIYDRRMV